MRGNFLTRIEFNIIKRDFLSVLRSKEGLDAVITYDYPDSPVVFDSVYKSYTASSWQTQTLSGSKCIQQIVTPLEEDILKWGIINVNDCILFFSADDENLDLSSIPYRKNERITIKGEEWIPIPRELKGFEDYIRMNFYPGEIAQAIPCRKAGN